MTVGGYSIFALCSLSIGRAVEVVGSLDLSERDHLIADRVFREVQERMQFLLDVGLDYLTLARSAATLSGGEAQRIRLASQIGSGLVGVLYVLDEPSIGLHQRDNQRLIGTLMRLRDLGNTVIVVEHDEETIRVADHVVDVGPGAGEHGGRIVHSGPVAGRGGLESNRRSITGQYLSGSRSIPVPAVRRRGRGEVLTVVGAREHNLADIDAEFPLGRLVAVTGVSGSGKSTLVNDILLRSLAKQVHRAKALPGLHRAIHGVEHVDKVVEVDQAPIGRTPRSNPATYTGVFDHIRKLFSQTQEAKVRGLPPGAVLVQREGRPLRGLLGRRDHPDRDALPPRHLRAVRGLPGGALQPGHARGHLPGQDHRRGARALLRGGARLLRPPAGHRPPSPDAGRRRASATSASGSRRRPCRAARPSGSSWPPSSAAGRPATRSTSSTSRPPACTSTTSASCSTC